MATISDSQMALKNDEREMLEGFDTNIVRIQSIEAPVGMMAKYKITVNAPTHYLENESSDDPKATGIIVFFLEVLNGYPNTKPRVYYPSGKRLASVNVFFPNYKKGMSSNQCTDEWYPESSSLFLLVEKTVRDIIHDPCVCRYDSMANPDLEDWHRENVKRGVFPTIEPGDIFRKLQSRVPAPSIVSKTKREAPPPSIVRRV